MGHGRLPFRKAPRRDSRYRCFDQRALRTPAPATCNERSPVQPQDWSPPATALRLSAWLLAIPPRRALQSQVEHLHVSVRPEHDILRLDVAVHNPGLMSDGERAGHLN